MIVFVAKTMFSISTHSTLELAKQAVRFRLQCEADCYEIEWTPVYFDEIGGEIVQYIPKDQRLSGVKIIITTLNKKY